MVGRRCLFEGRKPAFYSRILQSQRTVCTRSPFPRLASEQYLHLIRMTEKQGRGNQSPSRECLQTSDWLTDIVTCETTQSDSGTFSHSIRVVTFPIKRSEVMRTSVGRSADRCQPTKEGHRYPRPWRVCGRVLAVEYSMYSSGVCLLYSLPSVSVSARALPPLPLPNPALHDEPRRRACGVSPTRSETVVHFTSPRRTALET